MEPSQTPLHRLSVEASRRKFRFKVEYEEYLGPLTHWRAVLRIDEEERGIGDGRSKKAAAHAAAQQVLLKLSVTAPPLTVLKRLRARLAHRKAQLSIETTKYPLREDDPWHIELVVSHEVIGRGVHKYRNTAIAQAALAGNEWLNQQQTMAHALKHLAAARGTKNEERALRLIQTHNGRLPEWVLSSRKGIREEDLDGVDIVVTTDRGEIPLQVKSSLHGREKFLRNPRYSTKIYVLVVNDEKEDKALLWELRKALQNAYRSIPASFPSPSSV